VDIRPFGPDTRDDAVALINHYTGGWPYSRPVDDALLSRWATLTPSWQPAHVLIAYRNGLPVAFVHGERSRHRHFIHLLAVLRGRAADGAVLLQYVQDEAAIDGVGLIVGPNCMAGTFYGGYVLGLEPFHPHWAADTTESYVRAGFRLSHAGVLLTLTLRREPDIDMPPAPYQFTETDGEAEFDAQTFRYVATIGDSGAEVGTCGGRVYPRLRDEWGRPVGQIGHVETSERHRNRGIARIMVQMTLRRLHALGVSTVLIATGLDNAPALRCYERAGFERWHSINEWSKMIG